MSSRPRYSSFGQEKVNEASFFLFDFARRELSPLAAAEYSQLLQHRGHEGTWLETRSAVTGQSTSSRHG